MEYLTSAPSLSPDLNSQMSLTEAGPGGSAMGENTQHSTIGHSIGWDSVLDTGI